KADLAQPHAPRVCFALHKHRRPLSQEGIDIRLIFRPPWPAAAPFDVTAIAHDRKTGRGSRARTDDLRFWRPPLYQLSYTPSPPWQRTLSRPGTRLNSQLVPR